MFSLKKQKNEFRLEKIEDLNVILYEMQKNKTNEEAQFVAKELCSNVFKNQEKASIIVKNNLIHLMIDKSTLTAEKIAKLKLAIILARTFKNNKENISFKEEDQKGGFGIKMILNFGYDLTYKENENYFSVLAYIA
jgi:hypothetical protein